MSNSQSESRSMADPPAVYESSQDERVGPVFWAGLVVGILLTFGGFVSLSMTLVGNTTGQLILCSGLGIVFGAFGSTATVKYQGVVITGVAAIAVCLLVLIDHLIEDNYVELEITGDIQGAQVEVVGEENYLGAPRRRSHKFIILGGEIRKSHLTVTIVLPAESSAEREPEYIFECVHKDEIEPYLGSGRIVEWRFDKAEGQIFHGDRKIADVGSCPRRADAGPKIEEQGASLFAMLGSFVLSAAMATEPEEIQELIRDLESGSTYARRTARQSLAAQGLAAVEPLSKRLADTPLSYRTRLGVIVALTEMLRENKGKRIEISSLLTTPDLIRLVDASADRDRTIRVYASEFLYDLGDVRVVPLLFERFETADEDGKYNLLVVLDGTYPYLNKDAQVATNQKLSGIRTRVGKNTNKLIDRITSEQTTAAEPRYWVIVGSYTDKSVAEAHAKRINNEDSSLNAFVGKRMPENPYYPVIVGDYVPRQLADELVDTALRLKSIRAYGSAPYISDYPDRRP